MATLETCPAEAEVSQGYASDLMSDVLARAPRGSLLATIQTHMNVVAVAAHARLAGIIFTGNRRPDADVVARAAQEGIALYCTAADTFEVAGRLYALGLRGKSS